MRGEYIMTEDLEIKTPEFDIDLSETSKKTFKIKLAEDDIRELKLDPSDLMFIKRLNEVYPRLQRNADEAMKELDIDENKSADEIIAKTSETLVKIDADMRKAVDELFDTNVSEICAPTGSMYDPINGQFRFEHIINSLSNLYETNLNKEINKTMKKLNKHTGKYLKS